MERLDSIREAELTSAGFERFPIWTWDDEQEGYHPISGSGALPLQYPTLFIRAIFTTTSGRRVVGYLMGLESFFGFGLFVGGNDYLINLNLPDLAASVLNELVAELGECVLPLQYKADVAGHFPIEGKLEKI